MISSFVPTGDKEQDEPKCSPLTLTNREKISYSISEHLLCELAGYSFNFYIYRKHVEQRTLKLPNY